MRLPVLFAAAALLSTTLAAHAATITNAISINNVVAAQDVSGFYGANTNFFGQFNPSSGTLNSISLSLNGTATDPSSSFDVFAGVVAASAPQNDLGFTPQGYSVFGGAFPFSANGQVSFPSILAYFQGTGTQALRINFAGATTVNSASGTLTYNYTPTAAPPVMVPPVVVTPEPSSIALLGTGLLGLAGMVRKRLA